MRCLFCLLASFAAAYAQEPFEAFETKIRPILAKNCYSCHTQAALGGLRLDSKAAVEKGGKSGPAATHIARLVGEGKMPPAGKLSETEKELLVAWATKGAPMPDKVVPAAPLDRSFWSFQPVKNIPGTIDGLIEAKWREAGLKPVAKASRRDLLRRVTYDLTGLLPTYAELEAFEADKSPKAWEKVIDRLLASPRYGERQARLWLDLARYSDDKLNSTQDEPYPNSFRYRNWVIDAFNRDMPYNEFAKAQIAGDRTGHPAGTGFFALSPEMQDDRVDALTKTFLGLTVGCAQCHDHKFDPIPTQDYYSLQGVFSSSKLHEHPLVPEAEVKAWKAKQAEVELVEKRIKDFYERQTALLGEVFASQTARYLLAAEGQGEDKELDAATVKRVREYLAVDRIRHPFLNQFRLLAKAKAPREELAREAEAFQRFLLEVVEEKKTVDDKNKIKLGLDPSRNDLSQTQLDALPRDKTVLWRDFFDRAITESGGAFNYGTGVYYYGKNTIERFLSGTWKQYLDQQNDLLAAKKKELPPQYPYLQSLSDADKPADTNVLIRGDRNNKGEVAPRRFLAILSPGERAHWNSGSGREQLAEAIADPQNPLTARVMVNRVWQWHFGRGIVASASNFGQLGDRPTHPELLDHLASSFMAEGWSLKKLHKKILLSATYQLAAASVEPNATKDSENRLLWRANLRRLDAEGIRDNLLAAAGELDLSPGEKAGKLEDASNKKRTVYSFVGRRKLDSYLALFDFPAPLASNEARLATNVPLQRLFFLNSDFVAKRAEALGASLGGDEAAKIAAAYRKLYQRDPDAEELRLGREYLAKSGWASYARALLSANEFLFLP
jgi:cytochrome c5